MYKFIFVVVLLFQSSTADAFVLDLITTGVRALGSGLDVMNETIFRETMVASTIENVATLQRNFDESKRFYDEMRRIQRNPATLTDHARKETLERLRRSKDHAVHMAEMDYQRHYGKPGYIDRAFKQADDYIRTSLNFSDEARALLRRKVAKQKKIVEDLPGKGEKDDDARKKREEVDLRNDLMQTELLFAMNKNIVEAHRALVQLHRKLAADEAAAFARKAAWDEEMARLYKSLRAGGGRDFKTSEEAVRGLLP